MIYKALVEDFLRVRKKSGCSNCQSHAPGIFPSVCLCISSKLVKVSYVYTYVTIVCVCVRGTLVLL